MDQAGRPGAEHLPRLWHWEPQPRRWGARRNQPQPTTKRVGHTSSPARARGPRAGYTGIVFWGTDPLWPTSHGTTSKWPLYAAVQSGMRPSLAGWVTDPTKRSIPGARGGGKDTHCQYPSEITRARSVIFATSHADGMYRHRSSTTPPCFAATPALPSPPSLGRLSAMAWASNRRKHTTQF